MERNKKSSRDGELALLIMLALAYIPMVNRGWQAMAADGVAAAPVTPSTAETPSTPWFSERESGLWGGIAGGVLGCYGGLVGTLCGLLVPKGKGKRLVKGVFIFGIAVGVMAFPVGFYALVTGQPWYVWFIFLHIGLLQSVLYIALYFTVVQQGYKRAELRKMQAQDA